GFKYNLTDVAAAIGIEQLKKCRRFGAARAAIASQYDGAFAGVPEVEVPARHAGTDHAWHLYTIQLDLKRLRIGRAEFVAALKRRTIGTSVHFIPLHLPSYYRRAFGCTPADFPRASAAYERLVSLPIFPGMTRQDVADVVDAVTATVEEHRR